MLPPPKIKYLNLGKFRSWGLAFKETYEIHIEKKLKGVDLLDTTIHELAHLYFPEIVEEEIDVRASVIAKALWEEGWRKVDLGKS